MGDLSEKLGLTALMAALGMAMTAVAGLGAAMLGNDTRWMMWLLGVEMIALAALFGAFGITAIIAVWRGD